MSKWLGRWLLRIRVLERNSSYWMWTLDENVSGMQRELLIIVFFWAVVWFRRGIFTNIVAMCMMHPFELIPYINNLVRIIPELENSMILRG